MWTLPPRLVIKYQRYYGGSLSDDKCDARRRKRSVQRHALHLRHCARNWETERQRERERERERERRNWKAKRREREKEKEKERSKSKNKKKEGEREKEEKEGKGEIEKWKEKIDR